MISTHFANPILTEMSYTEPVLTVRLRGKLRTYYDVPVDVGHLVIYYGLSAYASLVKGNYKVTLKQE